MALPDTRHHATPPKHNVLTWPKKNEHCGTLQRTLEHWLNATRRTGFFTEFRKLVMTHNASARRDTQNWLQRPAMRFGSTRH